MGRHADDFGSGSGTSVKPEDYGEELLYANWNPAIAAMGATGSQYVEESSLPFFDVVSENDVDDFLARVYMLACQI